MIYTIYPDECNESKIVEILKKNNNIRFISFMGVDIGGNTTDEKIPVKLFLDSLGDDDSLLNTGIQTDGSSVVLHGIATLNNARVDLIPDKNVRWFIDYNYDNIWSSNNKPVGTLVIPSFLVHDGKMVCSRSVLYRSKKHFKSELMNIFKKFPHMINNIGIDDLSDIKDINLTSATELEMWVRTPNDSADIHKLSTSQILKEQYWKKPKGTIRTAMEESVELLNKYGFEPEMGHKEVGGVSDKIDSDGNTSFAMEQLEIDWKYSNVMQTADNELIARDIIEDVFRRYGLEVTFLAKPLENVAGSGEHTHVGVSVTLNDGIIKNIFTANDLNSDYLSEIGYGALMGILKNYEVINPFVSSSIDAFNRLKPGFEAPICTVTSLGQSVDITSRNRSVLVGVIRDLKSPLATRFEVRSPNPLSNTYLVLSSLYQSMIDGISQVANSKKNTKELEKEISKSSSDDGFYLDKNRVYRSEENVFEYYSKEERDNIFGKAPETVYENIKHFDLYKEKLDVLFSGEVFTKEIIDSFKLGALEKWETELCNRIIVRNRKEIKRMRKLHEDCYDCVYIFNELDKENWDKVFNLKLELIKDSTPKKSLFTSLIDAFNDKNYELASRLQLEINKKVIKVRELYKNYQENLIH